MLLHDEQPEEDNQEEIVYSFPARATAKALGYKNVDWRVFLEWKRDNSKGAGL